MSEQAAWGDEIVQLAELFHNIYEEEARRFGWKSQTPVPFGELPEANAQTMLCTVARVRREVCADRDELRAGLVRVTAERDEALARIERLNERIDHLAKKSNDWQDVSGLLNDQLSSALGKIERAKARLESGITHGFEIGHCSECDEIGWLLAFLKGDTE